MCIRDSITIAQELKEAFDTAQQIIDAASVDVQMAKALVKGNIPKPVAKKRKTTTAGEADSIDGESVSEAGGA
eukprot:12628056-Alexandrium_andersonii.AAC.1